MTAKLGDLFLNTVVILMILIQQHRRRYLYSLATQKNSL